MADTTEQKEKSWLSEFFDKVKDDLSWLWNKVKEWINSLFGKEIFEVTTQTKKELKKLEEEIIKVNESKLKDKEIEESVEWKVDDGKTILWILTKNSQEVKNWFNWFKDIDDEDMRSRETECILLMVKELSNNDSNNSKWDLTENELKQVWTFAKNKMDLLDGVLKSDDIKDLPDDKKTKKEVLKTYNDLLSENNWDTSKITKESIINKMKTPTEGTEETQETQESDNK